MKLQRQKESKEKEAQNQKETKETIEAKEIVEKNPTLLMFCPPPLWRPSLMPGWGHTHKGEKNKSIYFYGSVFFFFFSGKLLFRKVQRIIQYLVQKIILNYFCSSGREKSNTSSLLYLRNESIQSRRETH